MRQTWPDHFMAIAREVATMSTCIRREVGCVLVDYRNHILSTGTNGVPPGAPHCDPMKATPTSDIRTCPGAAEAPLGLSDRPQSGVTCEANHAEANAILHCHNKDQIRACYTTLSPCLSCIKMLLCTRTTYIVWLEPYTDEGDQRSRWERSTIVDVYPSQVAMVEMRRWLRYRPGMTLGGYNK